MFTTFHYKMLLQVNLEILKLKMVFTIVSGKKAGNAISADALRQLQAVFSVKDTITKKEARDIGVMSGATLTQVILNVSYFVYIVHFFCCNACQILWTL